MTALRSSSTFLTNLASNWVGFGANVVVAFSLSPFIVHSLGAEGYGVWTVLMSVTGYLGLADLGVRVSTGRFINYHLGRNEPQRAAGAVSTSLAIYGVVGCLVFLLSVLLGLNFSWLFPRLPIELTLQARWVLPVLGVHLWLTLYASTFAQVIIAANRFPAKNAIDLTSLGLRTACTITVLRAGYGFQGLTWMTIGLSVFQTTALWFVARQSRIVDLSFRGATREMAQAMASYSAWSFLFNAGARLVNYTDTIVIAILLGGSDVTMYALALMLLDNGTALLADIVGVMTPDIYKLAGHQELAGLHEAMVVGAQRTMFVAVPLLIGFMTMGSEFIGIWMGPSYAPAGGVLEILAFGQLGTMANRACGAAVWGLGGVRPLAQVKLLEGLFNLVLSVVLVRHFGLGLYGVALGTLVPMICVEWIFLPVFACRSLQFSPREYFRRAMSAWVPVAAGFAAVCMITKLSVGEGGWWLFFVKVATVSAIYAPIGAKVILRLDLDRRLFGTLMAHKA